MYNINTPNPLIDQFGIGKGEAQVIDLTPTFRRQEADALAQERRLAKKDKEDKDKEEAIYRSIAGVDAKAVKPNDVPYFMGAIENLYSDVTKLVQSDGSISTKDRVGLEKRISTIGFEAAASNNAKTVAQANLSTIKNSPTGTYYEEDVAQNQAFLVDPAYSKNWNTGELNTRKEYDYGKYVATVLQPEAIRYAEQHSGPYSSKFTLPQAEEMIDFSLKDEVNLNAVTRQMEKDKAKGLLPATYNDVNAYAKKNFAEMLTTNKKEAVPEWVANGGPGPDNDKEVRVTRAAPEVSNSGNEEYSVRNPKTNEEIVVMRNKKGQVIGGIKGGRLSPIEKSERDKAIAFNDKALQTFNAQLTKVKKDASEIKSIEKRVKYVEANMPVKPAGYPKAVPYKEKGVWVDAVEAQKIAFEKYAVDVDELAKGNQGNIKIQELGVDDERTKDGGVPKQRTISLSEAKAASPNSKLSDAEIRAKYLSKFNIIVK